jgi:hypothetical protein
MDYDDVFDLFLQKLKEQNIVLDPISVDGKRKYCDEQASGAPGAYFVPLE